MKCSPRFVAVVCLLVAAIAAEPAFAQTTTTYSLNLNPGTSNGQNVTNIMIFESSAGGSQLSIDYGGAPNAYSIAGSGLSFLTHQSAFTPAMSLIVGLTQAVDKVSLVIFMNETFAASAAGQNFSSVFTTTRHNEMITRMLAAQNGSAAEMDWFRNVFFPTDGMAAAFATGGAATGLQFTIATPIGTVPEQSQSLLLLGVGAAALLVARRLTTPRAQQRAYK